MINHTEQFDEQVADTLSKLKQGLYVPYPRIIHMIETLYSERNELAFINAVIQDDKSPAYVIGYSNDRTLDDVIQAMKTSSESMVIIPVLNDDKNTPFSDFLTHCAISAVIIFLFTILVKFSIYMGWFQ